MRKYLVIILILPYALAFGQENKYISDSEYLIEKLIETYPNPYTGFGGRIEFNQEKENIIGRITDSTTNDKFVILTNQLLSNLNDEHAIYILQKQEMHGKKLST